MRTQLHRRVAAIKAEFQDIAEESYEEYQEPSYVVIGPLVDAVLVLAFLASTLSILEVANGLLHLFAVVVMAFMTVLAAFHGVASTTGHLRYGWDLYRGETVPEPAEEAA